MKFYPIRHSLKALHRDIYYDIDAVSDTSHWLLTNKDKNYIDIDIRAKHVMSVKLQNDMCRHNIYLNTKEVKTSLMESVGLAIIKNRIIKVYTDKYGVHYKLNKLYHKRYIRFVVVKPKKVFKIYTYKKEI